MVIYYPVLQAGYIWDDDAYIINNSNLLDLGGLFKIWFDVFSIPQYYPLVHSTFWIEYQLWGLNPLGYHFTNVIIHIFNSLTLLMILNKMQIKYALFIVYLFCWHPVHVESVAWITERKNVLSLFFFLSSLNVFLNFYNNHRKNLYIASLALFILALLSKTTACVLPVTIVLLVWYHKRKFQLDTVKLVVPYAILGLGFASLTIWLERTHVGASGIDWDYSFPERLIIAGKGLWFYIFKLVFPYRLTFIYPKWVINSADLAAYTYMAGFIFLLAITFRLKKKIGIAFFIALLMYTVSIFPALGFFNIYPMRYSFVADHFQYLASISILCLLGNLIGANKIMQVLFILVFAALTHLQTYIYSNQEVLWKDTIRKNPKGWMAHNNLGLYFMHQERFKEAQFHFSEAIERTPPDPSEILTNQGNLFFLLKNMSGAIQTYEKAIAENPANIKPYLNLANLLLKQGQLDAARRNYFLVLEKDPKNATAYNNLGVIYGKLGDPEQANKYFKKTLQINPTHPSALANLKIRKK